MKQSNILFVVFTLMLIITAATSYTRFFVLADYQVKYEVECDIKIESYCFEECPEDEACTDENKTYYKIIVRDAQFLKNACESNISLCTAAQSCSAEEGTSCKINYCSPNNEDHVCAIST